MFVLLLMMPSWAQDPPGGGVICSDAGPYGLELEWSTERAFVASVPDHAATAEVRWRAYDGIHHDQVIVPMGTTEARTSLEVDQIEDVLELLDAQGRLDMTMPLSLRPWLWVFDENGASMGTSILPAIEVSWTDAGVTVQAPELMEPDVELVAAAPVLAGARIRRHTVVSRQSEPLELAADMDNSDKEERDHLPAVAKNLDLDRPLVSFADFAAAVADTEHAEDAEARYAALEAAHEALQDLVDAARTEVTP